MEKNQGEKPFYNLSLLGAPHNRNNKAPILYSTYFTGIPMKCSDPDIPPGGDKDHKGPGQHNKGAAGKGRLQTEKIHGQPGGQ